MTEISHKPHIIIVGAGLIGLSSAYSLAVRGARVTILERRSGPAMGASFSNSGMRHPSQARPWHVPNDYLRQMGIEGANPQSRLAMSSVLELAEMSKPLIANNMKRFSMTTSAEFNQPVFPARRFWGCLCLLSGPRGRIENGEGPKRLCRFYL